MEEKLVRVENTAYAKYEELLFRKDALKKEAFHLEREYVRIFGDLIIEVFQMKIECIRKKKSIEFCQTFINQGKAIDQDALQEYLKQEMAEYQKQLDWMIKDHEDSKKRQTVTEADFFRIKRIYHRLVKKIHPDINPMTSSNEELSDLWDRLVVAYNCNDLKEMEETEILINSVLDKLALGEMDITIPDIETKIAGLEAEIEKIKSTDPYQYKYLLEDSTAVSEKKESLKNELKEYEEYSSQLDEVLEGIMQKGVTFTWRMN